MSSQTSRRRFSIEQKVAILRRHLVDKVAVSDLCDEYKIQPSVFYQWQRQAMENLGIEMFTRATELIHLTGTSAEPSWPWASPETAPRSDGDGLLQAPVPPEKIPSDHPRLRFQVPRSILPKPILA